MAERTIGLRININGTQQVITQIEQLETLLSQAKADLKQVEIGSDAFKRLSQQISLAEGELEKLNQQSRSLTPERQVEGYSKLAGGITSSFAAATAAVQLFGGESEDVTKAVIQAQNLLTIALSARGIAELKTGVQIVANTIATKAAAAAANLETAATTRLTVATRAFYTTLAANPYGAILAAVTLLVTAFISLSGETEEAAEQTKTLAEYQLEAAQASVTETNKIKVLRDIINDTNKSLDARLGAYAALQKQIPILANYTLQEAQAQGILNGTIEEEIKLIELRAKAKALEDFLAEQEREKLKQQQLEKTLDAMGQYVELQKEFNRAQAGGFMGTFEQFEEQEKIRRNLIIQDGQLIQLAEERTGVEGDLYKVQSQIFEIEQRRQKAIDDFKKGVDKLNKSTEERNKEHEAYIDLLIEELRLQQQLIVQNTTLSELDNDILDTAQERVTTAQSYADALGKLKTFTELYKEALEDLQPVKDVLGDKFNTLKIAGENFIESVGSAKSIDALDKFNKEVDRLSKGLSGENLIILQDFANNYREIFKTFQDLQTFKGEEALPFTVGDFEKVVTDLNLALGKITIDPYKRSEVEIAAAKLTAKERYETLKQQFIDEYELYLEADLKKQGLTDKEIENRRKDIRTIAEATFDTVAGIGDELLSFEEGVVKTITSVNELNKELQKLGPEARGGFILENVELLADEYSGLLEGIAETDEELYYLKEKLRKRDYSEEEKYNETLIKLRESLAAKGIDISKLSYAEQLKVLEAFLNKEVELVNEAEDKKNKKRDESISKTLETIDDLRQIAESIASVSRESIALQLETLEANYEATMEKVVGDTKQANEKRIELEKQFEAERKALEKRARTTELSLALAQGIANTAEAITKTYAAYGGTPIGFVSAGVVAAVNAIQTGIIASQLAQIQSMRRGGITSGPSHEQGGITFGQAGVQLEGNEAVVNRQSTLNYSSLLSNINQSGGGRPLVVSSPMDSRLVEVLAKERQTPIRAYVVEQDITKAQSINRRLEQLSTF